MLELVINIGKIAFLLMGIFTPHYHLFCQHPNNKMSTRLNTPKTPSIHDARSYGKPNDPVSSKLYQDAHTRMGYKRPPTQTDIMADFEAKRRGLSYAKKSDQQIAYIKSLLNEMERSDVKSQTTAKSKDNSFQEAYQEINQMLVSNKPQLKQAVFLCEKAFLGDKITKDGFDNMLSEMTGVVSSMMRQKGLPKTNDAINMTVNQFMTDTNSIRLDNETKTLTTYPKIYDFTDPFGYENISNLFVSKLMATNSGQCKSLPLLYLMLVEELGGNAYLSFSPSHSYVKCKTSDGKLYSLELTNGMITSDSWVLASGFVKIDAIRSGIYMDTVNRQQVIAQCLVDLAQYYSVKNQTMDDFVLNTINTSLKYYPNNINALLVKADYYTLQIQVYSNQKGFKTIQEMKTDEHGRQLLENKTKIDQLIKSMGYERMSEKAYLAWLETLKERQRQQEHTNQLNQLQSIITE